MDRLISMAVFKRTVGSFAAAARHFGIALEMAGSRVRVMERAIRFPAQ
jgi:hypothetical protein